MVGKNRLSILIKKILHNGIFVKIIWVVLPVIFVYILGYFGFKSYEDLIKSSFDFIIQSIKLFWREIIIIVLLFTLTIISILKIYGSRIEFRNNKWIIKVIKNDPLKYSWLLWFVVNGTLVGKMQPNYVQNTGLYDSKVLMELKKRRIISIDQGNYEIIISDKTYDIIEIYLKRKKDKSLINDIRTTNFSDLVFKGVMITKYNVDN
jgi:hypothetical protein